MERPFYLVVPTYIMSKQELSNNDKIIYAIISNLSNEKGFCYASNNYIMNYINISKRTLQRCLNKLIELKLIIVRIKGNKRNIYITQQVQSFYEVKNNNELNEEDIKFLNQFNWYDEE